MYPNYTFRRGKFTPHALTTGSLPFSLKRDNRLVPDALSSWLALKRRACVCGYCLSVACPSVVEGRLLWAVVRSGGGGGRALLPAAAGRPSHVQAAIQPRALHRAQRLPTAGIRTSVALPNPPFNPFVWVFNPLSSVLYRTFLLLRRFSHPTFSWSSH